MVFEYSAPALSSRGSAVRWPKDRRAWWPHAWKQPRPSPVFLSYSRAESAAAAEALYAKLGEAAFLDTTAIDDGEPFPERLLDAILDAGVVVILATGSYAASHFCRLEMRLALGGDALVVPRRSGRATSGD